MSLLKKDLYKLLEAIVSLVVVALVFSIVQGDFSWMVADISVSEKYAIFIAISAFIRTYL